MNLSSSSFSLLTIFAFLCGCQQEEIDFESMEDAERQHNERASRELVAFMSLETMFPDESVRALAKAAGEGDVELVRTLAKDGVDPNSRGTKGAIPLFWALRSYDGSEALLELGADPNTEFAGQTVIHTAVSAADTGLVKLLLDNGASPTKAGPDLGFTPLHIAVGLDQTQSLAMIDLLLDAGADIDAPTRIMSMAWGPSGGSTPMMVAAETASYENVHYLLTRGADPLLANAQGKTLADRVSGHVGALRPESDSEKWRLQVNEFLNTRFNKDLK